MDRRRLRQCVAVTVNSQQRAIFMVWSTCKLPNRSSKCDFMMSVNTGVILDTPVYGRVYGHLLLCRKSTIVQCRALSTLPVFTDSQHGPWIRVSRITREHGPWLQEAMCYHRCPCQLLLSCKNGSAENARPENDGQRKLWVWKMQEWKMTDKLLANCEHNYRHE